MAQFLIVTDDASDWRPYLPSDSMVPVNDYLQAGAYANQGATQVLNLCRSYDYLSSGYYCSLLAEARGHRVIPSVMTINDLSQDRFFSLPQAGLDKLPPQDEVLSFKLYFGRCDKPGLERIGRKIFERFTVPVLAVELALVAGKWQVLKIAPFPFQELSDNEQDEFAKYLEIFARKVWRAPKPSRRFRYEIAMLVDEQEKMPPSDKGALKRFIKAANRIGMDLNIIGPEDLSRLGEYDGLFIRATTNIANFTYRFAKTAAQLGLVVMDDPESIMKCTNKVFLSELLANHKVSTPKSLVIMESMQDWEQKLIAEIGLPAVLKVPDGAFSLGVVKVKTVEELRTQAQRIFEHSSLILAQEYLPTEFDWRIGVLNRQPIYACRYYMSRGHWQIYQHHQSGRISSGGFDAVDLKQVPSGVLDVALKAANLIGSGFYGVDAKAVNGRACVIEVNDNPSVDHGVEDLFLGDLLYDRVMTEFLRRIQLRGL
ncbi:RimK family protein [Shewanella sedimentimangrovi]|uniref:RimK family protein n=1 Tax=Shewanella sedimentimangrovi TaxID=2814293 RepID=A0ABX7R581_9GAMM|nr:RimK family protein [Shewanella sedimentimangrovi]QSX38321.1 RimK family protein [Shewanella sedimentimangrovi]